jgi:hypothetical protein
MPRIQLEVFRGPHAPTASVLPGLTATRLIAQTRLVIPGASSGFHLCVIDTGAPISLFPARMWRGATISPLGRIRVGGLVARDECRIEVVLARVGCVLADGNAMIGPMSIIAYLSESNEVPALIGMAELIEVCDLRVSIDGGQVYLEA